VVLVKSQDVTLAHEAVIAAGQRVKQLDMKMTRHGCIAWNH
jgi:hypothetical protein